jgi:predicted DNA-binding ribbon-helix-helix protein
MRVKYPAKTYKLSKKTVKKLKEMAIKENLSFNLLFNKLIDNYAKKNNRD